MSFNEEHNFYSHARAHAPLVRGVENCYLNAHNYINKTFHKILSSFHFYKGTYVPQNLSTCTLTPGKVKTTLSPYDIKFEFENMARVPLTGVENLWAICNCYKNTLSQHARLICVH